MLSGHDREWLKRIFGRVVASILSRLQHCDSLCLLSNPRMSRINAGLMNNSETNKNGPTHTRTWKMLRSCSDWSAGEKREARAHWPAPREQGQLIGQLGVTERTVVTAAWRWVVHLPRMQRKQCLQVLQPVAWSKQTVYFYGAAPAATTARLIGN